MEAVFKGAATALITPFDQNGSVDYEAFGRLIDWQIDQGIDGLLIESHPNPKVAKSDADQQLNFEEFRSLHATLKTVATAVGYTLV